VIQDATRDDLGQILAIYNEVIRNSTAVYSEEEFTPDRGATWFRAKMEQPASHDRGTGCIGITDLQPSRVSWLVPLPAHRNTASTFADRRGMASGGRWRSLLVRAAAGASMSRSRRTTPIMPCPIGPQQPGIRRRRPFHEVGFKFGRA
jgi:phosphinothricin acetyltransferase